MNAPQRSITGIATVGIPVTDQDRALGSYTATLGMEKRLEVPLPQSAAAGSRSPHLGRRRRSPSSPLTMAFRRA